MFIQKTVLTLLMMLAMINAYALIIIPIPNLGFPPIIAKTRDALEKSSETKALATVGEDKTFGSRMWAYGDASGQMSQAEADAQALRKCSVMLQNLKSQSKGGQPLYDFGNNQCELYKFNNVTQSTPEPAPAPAAPPAQPSQESEIVQKMKSLESLLKEKLITQEEFDAKKKQLLNGL